jgi:ABC-type nitrate/sulfonate/bicarbonate transport system substrate-binding protein
MNTAVRATALALAALLGACGGSATGSAPKNTTIDTTAFTVGWGGPPDVGDLPQLIAFKAMQAKGYNISQRVFSGDPLLVTAANQGDAQIMNMAAVSVLNADLAGNDLKVFLANTANETQLMADSKFKTPKDLNGMTMALASPTSSTHTLALWTEQKYGIKFKYVYEGASVVRAKALLAHRVDCSILEIDDINRIIQNDPNGFRVMVDYFKELPWLLASVWVTTGDFAKKHPTIVQEYTNALIAGFADAYKHPDKYVQQGPSVLTGYDNGVIAASMKKSVDFKVWGDDGRINKADAQKSLDFWTSTATITTAQQSQLKNLNWFDGSFVQNASQP